MDFNQPFSVLNEKLRPRVTTSEQLYSSLTRLEGRQLGSLRNKYTYYRATVLPREPEPNATTKTEDPEESVDETEKDYSKGNTGKNTCLINELNLNDIGEDELGDEESTSQSDEKDSMGEVASEEARDSEELGSNENTNSFQRDYLDGTLPDLLNSGKPLSRRRTLGHYSDTLKEVRREVELSRRRSIKLKAQVDKLQESREGQGWSQHKDRVTEEVLSILRLLHPLTEPESSQIEPPDGENRLDAALAQLQNVARKLAISHTKQESKPGGKVAEDSAILQQALRDRDEAIEKKKAMEAELLRSKTEMMTLNNHLLEAAQKRLELSLELEAWKEDFQLILQQQVKSQQQAEQNQKKPSRMGLLRRTNRAPMQRPTNFPVAGAATPANSSNQNPTSKSAASAAPAPKTPPTIGRSSNWRDKLRMGKSSRQGDQDLARGTEEDDGFQVVSLD
ncbi:bicaudal-D-related protein 2-like [Oreochromis aureus]|uniref:bicaudal-D-related protein 2-like n=1 Tax=Oreochromis aureus TaxID=47969 RepID=UPI001953A375|nr:bicaudal-D-related protein 2-like [Oreochromis aureus]